MVIIWNYNHYQNHYPPPRALPIISEEIKNRLLEELGLDIDWKTQEILRNTGKEIESPRQKADSLINTVFNDLIGSNRGFVQVIFEDLSNKTTFKSETDDRTMGMAIILRAFDEYFDFDLIPRFGSLLQEDLNLTRRIIREDLPPKGEEESLLGRLLKMPRVPEQQIALNEILRKAKKTSSFNPGSYVYEGASIMYQILGHLWPKLFPQNQTTPPEPLPPTTL